MYKPAIFTLGQDCISVVYIIKMYTLFVCLMRWYNIDISEITIDNMLKAQFLDNQPG